MILLKRLCNYEYAQKVNAKETIDTNDLVINVDSTKKLKILKRQFLTMKSVLLFPISTSYQKEVLLKDWNKQVYHANVIFSTLWRRHILMKNW